MWTTFAGNGTGGPDDGNGDGDGDDKERAPPVHKVILFGNFTSSDGEDYTQQCMDSYTNNLRDKAAGLIPSLNGMLGEQLCPYIDEDDMRIITVSTIFKASGSAVSMTPSSHHLPKHPLALKVYLPLEVSKQICPINAK